MEWINIYGLLIVIIIMIPNIIYAVRCAKGGANGLSGAWSNPLAETLEQIGRYGCMITMILNIPGLCAPLKSREDELVYLAVNGILIAGYLAAWMMLYRRERVWIKIALAVLPSLMFLFCGIMTRSVLTLFALIFAPCHILITCKNAAAIDNGEKMG